MSNEELNTGYLLNKVTQQMKSHLARQLQEVNLTIAQWGVIRDLYAQAGLEESVRRTTSADIADRMHMDRPTLSGIVERLRSKGLLMSKPNMSDRRSYRLALTEEAITLYEKIEPYSQHTLTVALKGISKSEIELFQKTIMIMLNNFEHNEQ